MSMRRSWLLGLAMGVLACGGYGGSGPSENAPSAGDVTVANDSFTPGTLSIVSGSTVTWTWNSGGEAHNVTFDDGIHSVDQGSGTYQRTFAQAGSFPYHCTIHGPAMSGVVNVGSASGGGGGGGGGGPGY
jgi:plastocyanin